MQPAQTTIHLLCLTEEPTDCVALADQFGFADRESDLSAVDSVDAAIDHVADQAVDCVLCGDDDDQRLLDTVRTLRGEYPSVPIVAFVGQRPPGYVEAILDAGATELVQSHPDTVPASLLQRRVESVVAKGSMRSARDRAFERYQTILNAAVDAIYQLDTDGRVVAANDAAVELTGYDRSELIGSHVSLAVDGDDIRRGNRLIREALEQGADGTETLTTAINTKDGDRIPCEARIAVLQIDGEFEGSVGVLRDVSDRIERQEALQAERDLVQRILDVSPVGLGVVDAAGDIVRANERVSEILGVSQEKLLERTYDSTDWDVRDESGTPIPASEYPPTQVFESGEPVADWEARVAHPDGEHRWISFSAVPLDWEDDEVTRVVMSLEDITERKETEQRLRAEQQFVEQILETSPVGICVIDEDGNIVQVNSRATEIFGVDAAEFTDRTAEDSTWRLYDEDGRRVPPAEFASASVFETGEPVYDWEVQTERADGERVWISVNGAPILDDGSVSKAVVSIEKIEERKRREQKIATQRDELEQLDRLNAVIRDVDQALVGVSNRDRIEQLVCEQLTSAGRYQFALWVREEPDGSLEPAAWTEAAEGYVDEAFPVPPDRARDSPGPNALESGDVQVLQDISDSPRVGPPDAREKADVESMVAIPVTYDDRTYGILAVYAGERDAFSEREQEVLGELGETIGYAIAAVERREREQTLTSLYEATRALLGTETEREVCDLVVDVAADVLELPGVGIFLFDDEENWLEPVGATDTLLEFYGDQSKFGPGQTESEAWHTYVTGTEQVFDDIREAERCVDPDTDARSVLLIPLGDHGVFVAAAETAGIFDDQKRNLVGLLAATTEAALDRVARRAGIRKRDEELAERARKLERLARVNDLVRDVAGTLIRTSSRTDIEHAVCERIVAEDEFAFAWVGSTSPDRDGVEPRRWAGDSSEYLDAIDLGSSAEPGVATAIDGSATVVDNVTDRLREATWARSAIEYGYQSVLAVPLVYGETTYGILAVYATTTDAFDETTEAVLAELGELVAYSINVAETKQGILAEEVTEIELLISEPDTFLNAVATLTGSTVQYREITPGADGDARVLFELTDPPVDAILDLESEFVAVDELTHVEHGDDHLFRARLGGETVAGTLLECGGIPNDVVASAEETRAVIHLPQQLDVREFLDRIRESYPGTELTSRQDVDRQTSAQEKLLVPLDEQLTDRQQEVLLTAYESGFFESPRETTGAELADLLDVSQPTVTHHLREAQRRLFSDLFEDSA